jgi:hypothetical protein
MDRAQMKILKTKSLQTNLTLKKHSRKSSSHIESSNANCSQNLMSTLGNDDYGLSQIKIGLQRLRNGNLSCIDLPHAGRPPLTLGPQVEAFLHFSKSILWKCPHNREALPDSCFYCQRNSSERIEMGMKKFSRRWVPHSLSDVQKVARVEAAKNVKHFA